MGPVGPVCPVGLLIFISFWSCAVHSEHAERKVLLFGREGAAYIAGMGIFYT